MQDVYKTPEANLLTPGNSNAAPFYIVSPRKFSILYIATMGLYGFYWFWENWSCQRRLTGEKIQPFWRAFFNIFFVHKLFGRMSQALQTHQIPFIWQPKSQATLYISLVIVGEVANRLSIKKIGTPITDFIGLVFLAFQYMIVNKAQQAANLVCGDVDGRANEDLTGANYAWIALGALLWILTFVGLVSAFIIR